MKADRCDACVSAYETLIEKARTSNIHAGVAAILVSHDRRRVVTMVGVRGHDGFAHLKAAWDDHHQFAQHRAVAESVSLDLYEVAASAGDSELDPSSHDAYEYEHLDHPVPSIEGLISEVGTSIGLRGASILHSDDARTTVILSRFAHSAEFAVFRAGNRVAHALGAVDAPGTSAFQVHPAKTFGP